MSNMIIREGQTLLEQAKQLARTWQPKPADNASQHDWRSYNAVVDRNAAEILVEWHQRSWCDLRRHVFEVFMSNSWREEMQELTDALGNPTGEAMRRFTDFADWFSAVVSHLNPTYRSTLWSNSTIMLPAIVQHEIKDTAGNPISLEDVFRMNESQWQMLAAPAKKFIHQIDGGSETAKDHLGQAIAEATSGTPKRKLQSDWKERGWIDGDDPVIGYQIFLDDGRTAYVILPQDDVEVKRVQMAIAYHVDLRIIEPEGVRTLLSEVFNAPDENEFDDYLNRI